MPEAGEAEEHSLQVGVVKTRHSSLRAEEGSELFSESKSLGHSPSHRVAGRLQPLATPNCQVPAR